MSTNGKQLSSSVRTIIAELAETRPEIIKAEDRLRLDLGLDSLQEMELMSRLSEDFDIDPEMEDVMAVKTVADVERFLAQYLPAGS